MNAINQVIIVGRLVRDAEVRFAATGAPVASFSFAANRRYQDKDGQWNGEVASIPCTAFGRTAEQLAERHKEEPVLVSGRLRTESWQKDGANRSRLVLVDETVDFVLSGTKPSGANRSTELPLFSEEVRQAVPF
jgi:single-strand DNA-binding protein